MVTDPIADMLVSLVNGTKAGRSSVTVPASKVKLVIAEFLKQEGWLKAVVQKGKKVKKLIQCDLAPARPIQGVKRLSRPGRRVYWRRRDLAQTRRWRGMVVLSTARGLMTAKTAREMASGGEALFEIW